MKRDRWYHCTSWWKKATILFMDATIKIKKKDEHYYVSISTRRKISIDNIWHAVRGVEWISRRRVLSTRQKQWLQVVNQQGFYHTSTKGSILFTALLSYILALYSCPVCICVWMERILLFGVMAGGSIMVAGWGLALFTCQAKKALMGRPIKI